MLKGSVIALAVLALFCVTSADVPRVINFQGYLVEGQNPVSGNYGVTFRIFDAASGGSQLWQETDTVSVQSGLYSINLGQRTPINVTFVPDRWLEIQFLGQSPMTPRYRLTSEPFSYTARYADSAATVQDGAITNAKLASNSVNSAKIQDGVILFQDIAQNGATNGQVMKWNGTAWVALNDEVGQVADNDWVINGSDIYHSAGNVGIGMSAPTQPLHVHGNVLFNRDVTGRVKLYQFGSG